ncbi:SpoIIE family protein phosphatase [Limibacter armeniacum]|uniref:PP2C family protein-serine/threonine phosphatase n=1 Tax=Limibacter armeniacum TaxID=466084 RepID=UPI002FE50219
MTLNQPDNHLIEGHDQSVNQLEFKIFKFSSLTGACVAIAGGVIPSFFKNYQHVLILYLSLTDVLVFTSIFLFAVFKKVYKSLETPFIAYLIFSISVHFVISRGHVGTMPYVQLMAVPLIIATVRKERLHFWLATFFSITIVLHLISHLKHEWIFVHDNSSPFIMTQLTVFLLCMLTTSIAVLVLKYNYQAAHRMAIIKRQRLEQQQQLLVSQKHKINRAFDSITESIRYAKRIQHTLLPSEDDIHDLFPESFVFFQPKDIVSGDFYWFTQLEDNLKIMVVADCTGHGVPGAFMSVLGHVFLDHIVNIQNTTSPAEILELLDQKVKTTLKQEGKSSTNDGMEVAICALDSDAKTLTFAGAKMPLYYIQNGESYLIRGSKRSIGSNPRGHINYEEHTISVEAPTCCYIYSDGFQDQFGGPRNKKFLSKNLRELISENCEKDMEDQEFEIVNTFLDWKGGQLQVDDVLIVGFRADLA